jgi:hypothetical protein
MIVPSTISNQGAFSMEVLATGSGYKSFVLYKRTANISKNFVKVKTVNGKTTKDLETPDSSGQVTYEMQPFSGLNATGSKGAMSVPSPSFYPYGVTAEQGYWFVNSGTYTTLNGSKYYGGQAIETTSAGASATPFNCTDYNDGFVVATGPQGGIGTVQQYDYNTSTWTTIGSINFYSSTVKGFEILFKHGTGTAEDNYFQVVQTGTGAGGGIDMMFTGIAVASACT